MNEFGEGLDICETKEEGDDSQIEGVFTRALYSERQS